MNCELNETAVNSCSLYISLSLSLSLVQHANEDVEKMILGNKCDMSDKRVVSKERGEAVSRSRNRSREQNKVEKIISESVYLFSLSLSQIAREHGIRFMETSAKSNINIERAFCELAEAILDKTSGRESAENQERVIVDRGNSDKAPGYNKCCA